MFILFAFRQFFLWRKFIIANLQLSEDFVDDITVGQGGPTFF